MNARYDPAVLAEQLAAGNRRALARAITLVESTRTEHRALAADLLRRLHPTASGSIRLGISGVPGVGKSTFIEALGMHVLGRGHRLAVLAVDPSSSLSGGSILGDKTRMEQLARSRMGCRDVRTLDVQPSARSQHGVDVLQRASWRIEVLNDMHQQDEVIRWKRWHVEQ